MSAGDFDEALAAAREVVAAVAGAAATLDAALWELLAVVEQALALPAAARVDGERVQLTHLDYGGREDQGLLAEIDEAGRRRRVALTRVRLLKREPGAALVAAYGEWIKGRRAPAAMRPPAPGSGREPSARIADGEPVALAVLGVGPRAARCRRVDDGSLVAYRPADRVALAPGTVVTVKARVAAGRLEGEVIDTAVDAEALGLEPLGLVELAPGPPRRVRLAPLAPADALEEAARLAEFGDPEGAIALAHAALDEDLRRLDAHAILGDIALGADRVADALAHYAVGAAIGDLSVPAEGAGELPWSEADNHAYLACLYGCARALRRLGRERDAAAPLARLLALDPDDGLGASGLMRALQR